MGSEDLTGLPNQRLFERLARLNKVYLLSNSVQYRAQWTDMGRWSLSKKEVRKLLERIEADVNSAPLDSRTAGKYLPTLAKPIDLDDPDRFQEPVDSALKAFGAEIQWCKEQLDTEPFSYNQWYSSPSITILERYEMEGYEQSLVDVAFPTQVAAYLPRGRSEHRSFSSSDMLRGNR